METQTESAPKPSPFNLPIFPVADLEAKAKTYLVISTTDEYQAAGKLLLEIKAGRATVKADNDPICEAAHKTHKLATEHRAKQDKPLAALETMVAQAISAFETKERLERDRIARENAEKIRLATEAASKKAEEDRKAQEKANEDAKIETAAALEAAGDTEKAQAVLEAPPEPVCEPLEIMPEFSMAVFAEPATLAKLDGVNFRDAWKWKAPETPEAERNALLELVKAAATDPDRYLGFLLFNDSALNKYASSMGGGTSGSFAKVPGQTFWNDRKPVKARGA